jgi:aspartate/methionine/tyrosine aminotransferase
MYLFADIREFGLSSFGFCQRLLDEARVLASPGSAFGAAGEGFVRFSWLVPADDIRTAIERLGQFVISLRRKAAPPPRHSVEGGMQ